MWIDISLNTIKLTSLKQMITNKKSAMTILKYWSLEISRSKWQIHRSWSNLLEHHAKFSQRVFCHTTLVTEKLTTDNINIINLIRQAPMIRPILPVYLIIRYAPIIRHILCAYILLFTAHHQSPPTNHQNLLLPCRRQHLTKQKHIIIKRSNSYVNEGNLPCLYLLFQIMLHTHTQLIQLIPLLG